MIAHILGAGSMFTKDTYEMISQYFNNEIEEHIFISKFPNYPCFTNGNCRVIKSRSIEMLRVLSKADAIVVHGLINRLIVWLLAAQPWLLKKCNWIVWGGDIYIHTKKKLTLVEKFTELLKKSIIPHIPVITTVAKGDYELAQKWYGAQGVECSIVYPVPAGNQEVVRRLIESKKTQSNNVVRIIVGNSATITNQHKEALELLSKFRNEEIEIYLPLSYGTGEFQEYANDVISYAQSIFGDKVFPVQEKMNGEEYLGFLGQMHVGIFNNNRQQAMGNISQLVMMGTKVYIRDDTKMWGHFNDLGCKLFNIKDINNMSTIKELYLQPEDVKENNMKVIEARHSMNNKVEMWAKMFVTMKKVIEY